MFQTGLVDQLCRRTVADYQQMEVWSVSANPLRRLQEKINSFVFRKRAAEHTDSSIQPEFFLPLSDLTLGYPCDVVPDARCVNGVLRNGNAVLVEARHLHCFTGWICVSEPPIRQGRHLPTQIFLDYRRFAEVPSMPP